MARKGGALALQAHLLVALAFIAAGCSPAQAGPRLVYVEDGVTSGSAPVQWMDTVHFGFGSFRVEGGPIELWGIDPLSPDGFDPAGQGFVQVPADGDLCNYSVAVNDRHACKNVVSIGERPVLKAGDEVFLVLSVFATEPGTHVIGPVEVQYAVGDVMRSLQFDAADRIRTATPFRPQPPSPPPVPCRVRPHACPEPLITP